MPIAIMILRTIAKELAEMAKAAMPKIQNGETINREWLKDGIYGRETILDGKKILAQYDFKQRKLVSFSPY